MRTEVSKTSCLLLEGRHISHMQKWQCGTETGQKSMGGEVKVRENSNQMGTLKGSFLNVVDSGGNCTG
jgi:hypothetical protein